jgi:hypothetical protein
MRLKNDDRVAKLNHPRLTTSLFASSTPENRQKITPRAAPRTHANQKEKTPRPYSAGARKSAVYRVFPAFTRTNKTKFNSLQ